MPMRAIGQSVSSAFDSCENQLTVLDTHQPTFCGFLIFSLADREHRSMLGSAGTSHGW